MNKETLDRLRLGRERVATPGGWTQGKGRRKLPDDTVQYCAVGGVYLYDRGQFDEAYFHAVSALSDVLFRPKQYDACGYVTAYNDAPDTTQADIVALYDKAIERGTRSLAVQLLRDAAQRFEDGSTPWHPQEFGECAWSVLKNEYCDGAAQALSIETLRITVGVETHTAIWTWNDASDRTKTEVIVALRAAASTLEAS